MGWFSARGGEAAPQPAPHSKPDSLLRAAIRKREKRDILGMMRRATDTMRAVRDETREEEARRALTEAANHAGLPPELVQEFINLKLNDVVTSLPERTQLVQQRLNDEAVAFKESMTNSDHAPVTPERVRRFADDSHIKLTDEDVENIIRGSGGRSSNMILKNMIIFYDQTRDLVGNEDNGVRDKSPLPEALVGLEAETELINAFKMALHELHADPALTRETVGVSLQGFNDELLEARLNQKTLTLREYCKKKISDYQENNKK